MNRVLMAAWTACVLVSSPSVAAECQTVEFQSTFADPGGPSFLWLRNTLASATLNPYHYLPDVFVEAGEDQRFYFHGLYGRGIPSYDLYKEQVQLHISDSDGNWSEAQTTRTSRNGSAGFYLEGEDALGAGSHHVKAWVPGDDTQANAFAWSWNPGMRAIVTDIDGTCTLDNLQQFLDIIYDIGPFDYVPEVKPGAPELLQFWASRNIAIIYITARPLYLKDTTINWLRAKGFPMGPLIMYGGNGGILPPIGDSETIRYKSDRINDLEDRMGVRVLVAYGNSATDRDAFCEALEIPPERIFMIDCPTCGPVAECENSVLADDWFGHLADLEDYGIPVVNQPCP